MLTVVSYDIVSDSRRQKLAKLLEGYGERQQYSLFECDLSERKLQELERRIKKIVDKNEDSVRIYKVCSKCMEKIIIIGNGVVFREPDVIII
ncbi:MAG TPA: CRISPR-associated endonuclease Cas2 [Spirochaetota bacterium]|nr:CRISPR-associated endonuclease Cas2 [Spirochaetota bacterium]HOK91910.1 CRISPR-associated endonuclease Cas2 [Spirochaetota bacterium]HPP96112.1 CRISPR-associated endonuclease Cas2 [Spirochaetota bacterium]HRS64080.1 CRISPR-associated endonuclease Cas2 [Spirochaetota bacterium]